VSGTSPGTAAHATLTGLSNSPPIANDDTMSTTVNISAGSANVLANDFDANADPLTVVAADSQSLHGGTVINNNNATFNYTPSPGFTGHDSFTYTISDGQGGQDIATVQINVMGAGRISVGGAGGCSLSMSSRDSFDPLLPLLFVLSLLWMRKRREI